MSGDSFVAFILDQLEGAGRVTARRMFGGHGLYLDAVFFGIIHQEELYFKTDAESRQRYLELGMQPFRPTERQTLRSYFQVPAGVIEDPDELRTWAREAAAAARSA